MYKSDAKHFIFHLILTKSTYKYPSSPQITHEN